MFTIDGGALHTRLGFTNLGTLKLVSGTAAVDNDSVLTNSGVVRQQGSANLTFGGGFPANSQGSQMAILHNLAGGLYEIEGDGDLVDHPADNSNSYQNRYGTITNAGVFRKSGAGESVTSSRVGFHNTGTVEVTGGAFKVQGGGSSTGGMFTIANGATLSLAGAAFSLSGDNSFTGSGALEIAGATLGGSSAPTIIDGPQLVLSAGTLNSGTGTMTISGGTRGYFSGGTINGAGGVINGNELEWSGGQVGGKLTNTSPGLLITGTAEKRVSGLLQNRGVLRQLGSANLIFGAGSPSTVTLNNMAGGLYEIEGNGDLLATTSLNGNLYGTINNAGTFRKSGADESVIGSRVPFNNTGTVEVTGGTLKFDGGYTQTAGDLVLKGGSVGSSSPLNLQGGQLLGSGVIDASIANRGAISPGFSPGILTVNGSLSLLNTSQLKLEIGGLTQGSQYDYLDVNGTLSLGGVLSLSFVDGFESLLLAGNTFTLVTADAPITGSFSNVANGLRLATMDGLGSFQVNYGSGSAFGSNNIVVSQGQAVPEPGASMLIVLNAGALLLRRWRR